MSDGYKLKNTISHVMNIQVYCKDGIYSSVISQHIGVLDARIRGRLKNKYCKFCGM